MKKILNWHKFLVQSSNYWSSQLVLVNAKPNKLNEIFLRAWHPHWSSSRSATAVFCYDAFTGMSIKSKSKCSRGAWQACEPSQTHCYCRRQSYTPYWLQSSLIICSCLLNSIPNKLLLQWNALVLMQSNSLVWDFICLPFGSISTGDHLINVVLLI